MKITSAHFVKGVRGTDDILYDGLAQIAFIGRSNVGKSSVINALVNKKDLVKVGKKPGKTTEVNLFKINNAFYFVDLPGYGYAKVDPKAKEKILKMIVWYLTYSDVKPRTIVLILDIRVGITDFDRDVIQLLREHAHHYILVANKSDKLGQKEITQQLAQIRKESGENVIPFSATTKSGLDVVLQSLFS